ncbi:MAG: hypothetical protein OEU90_14400, partial [Gammaproteobacteria bacterium]|nr:hypothetical protein [Gammaproteobacteria bacterium]
ELRKKLPALNDALREREASIDDLIAELSRERNKIYSLEQAVAQTRSVDSGPVEVERTGANVIRIQQHRESGAPATEAQLSNAPDYYEQQVRELQAELQEWKHKYEASRQNKDHITTKLSARRKSIGRRTTKREKDNLKMIYGIGPVLETTLNELGFFQIDQLADIDDNDIERFATHDSSLPGRLRRDKWVEQAKKLRGSGQPDRRRPRA